MKRQIYLTIDSANPAERYEVVSKLREKFPSMTTIIDQAMEVYIAEDLFSKDEKIRSLAYIEKIKKENSQHNLAFIDSLFSHHLLTLSNTKLGGGWVVFIKDNCVISSEFDKNFNFTNRFSIDSSKYKRLANPVNSLYGGSVINSKDKSKKILSALKGKINKESSELTLQ